MTPGVPEECLEIRTEVLLIITGRESNVVTRECI